MLSEREKFSALLALALDGLASEEELGEFRSLLRANPDFLKIYQRQVYISVLVRAVIPQGQSDAEDAAVCPVERRVFTQRKISRVFKTAAAAVFIISTALLFKTRSAALRTAVPPGGLSAAAVLSRWDGPAQAELMQSPPFEEMLVKCKSVALKDLVSNLDFELQEPGGWGFMSQLSVQEGSYTFWLESGVTCYVKAPAELVFGSSSQIYLKHGELLVRVDKGSTGFNVETSLLKVRDMGTMFGVAVDEKGVSDVMVTEGRVLLEDRVGKSLLMLFKGNGVKMRQPGSCSLLFAESDIPESFEEWCARLQSPGAQVALTGENRSIPEQAQNLAASGSTAKNAGQLLRLSNTRRTLGINVFMSAATLSLITETGSWAAHAAGCYDYWDPSGWQDGVAAQGSGSTALFTNNFSNLRLSITNDLTLARLFMNPAGDPTLDLEGDGAALHLDGGALPEIAVHRGRLNSYVPLAGSVGFVKSGRAPFYVYCRSQMTGPITVRGGVLGVDFNRDADSTRPEAVNHLQPDGVIFSSAESSVRLGPRESRTADQRFAFKTAAGSATADVTAEGELPLRVSAGQMLECADGTLADATFIRSVLPDNRVRLSAPAQLTGVYDVTVKAKNFTSEQHFDYVDLNVSGTLFFRNMKLSIDNLLGSHPVTIHSASNGVVEFASTGNYDSKVKVNGDLKLVMNDQRAIPPGPAANPSFHVDASAANTLVLVPAGGDLLVKQWNDRSGTLVPGSAALLRFAVSDTRGAAKPKLVPDALNGLPVIDFGPAGSGKGLVWSDPSLQIRTVFWVIGSQAGGGLLLGSKDNHPLSFERGGNVLQGRGTPGPYTEPHSCDDPVFGTSLTGDIWISGDKVRMDYSGLSGGFDLVAYRVQSEEESCSASAFAMRQSISDFPKRSGGQMLAEVIVYERILTDAELRDTQAYLARKWFDRDLPGYGGARLKEVEFLQSAESVSRSTLTQQGGSPLKIDMLTVQSNRTMAVSDGSEVIVERAVIDPSATLELGRSTIALRSRKTPLTLPVADSTLHFDASAASSLTLTNGSEVALWKDPAGGLRCAEGVAGFLPTLVPDTLNALPVVDFGEAGSRQFLIWDTNVVIRSLFFVMNLRGRAITPLGSHRRHFVRKSHFTRYNGTGSVWDPVTQPTVLSGECYIDGKPVRPDTFTLPENQFVLLGQVLEGSSIAGAFGCEAYDHNTPEDIAGRTGGQQLAEVVIYSRKLTQQESLDVQAYLRWKWFGTALAGYAAPGQPLPAGAVHVAAGKRGTLRVTGRAAIDLGQVKGDLTLSSEAPVVAEVASGSELNLDRVAISGSAVAGRTAAARLDMMDMAAGKLAVEDLRLQRGAVVSVDVLGGRPDQIAVAGELTVDGGGMLELLFDHSAECTGVYEIMTFGSITPASRDHLADWRVAGNIPVRFKAELSVSAQALRVTVTERER